MSSFSSSLSVHHRRRVLSASSRAEPCRQFIGQPELLLAKLDASSSLLKAPEPADAASAFLVLPRSAAVGHLLLAGKIGLNRAVSSQFFFPKASLDSCDASYPFSLLLPVCIAQALKFRRG